MDREKLLAPMAATVVRVDVRPGDEVRAGQQVVVLNTASMFEVDSVAPPPPPCGRQGRTAHPLPIDPADTRTWITATLASAPAADPGTGKRRPHVDTR